MAEYCLRCGAYLPTGKTKCIACGFSACGDTDAVEVTPDNPVVQADIPSRKRGTEASDALKRKYDEHIQRQKENAKKWSDQAYIENHRAVHKDSY